MDFHDLIQVEKKPVKIRRYMDFSKLMSLITSKGIYFASPHQLTDRFDCVFPDIFKIMRKVGLIRMHFQIASGLSSVLERYIEVQNLESLEKDESARMLLALEFSEMLYKIMYDINKNFVFDDEIMKKVKDLTIFFVRHLKEIKTTVLKGRELIVRISQLILYAIHPSAPNLIKDQILVSCWNMPDAEHESDLLWKVYGKTDGFAIETTSDKLKSELNIDDFKHVQIGNVNYCDVEAKLKEIENMSDKDLAKIANEYEFLFMKRLPFIDEKEIRMILIDPSRADNENSKIGTIVPLKIPIEDFIDKIIVSPFAPNNHKTIVDTLTQLGLSNLAKKVEASKV